VEPEVGIEPTTYRLQGGCSTTELHRRRPIVVRASLGSATRGGFGWVEGRLPHSRIARRPAHGEAGAVNAVDPADTALLVTRALRRGSTLLAVLVAAVAVNYGVWVEMGLRTRHIEPAAAHAVGLQHAGVALAVGLVSVLVLHFALGIWARRRLDDRLEREWAAVEPRWSQRRAL
jgi:hypothetical protein